MAGSVSEGTPGFLWQRISGGGSVVFSDNTSATSSVTFDTEGAQVLRLLATQNGVTTYDEVSVTVEIQDLNNNDVPDSWEAIHEDGTVPGTVLLGDGNRYNIRDVYFWGLDSNSPEPLQAESPVATTTTFAFQFYGVSGVTYRILRSDDLTDENAWNVLPGYESISGANADIPVTDSAPLQAGMYRIVVLEN